MDTVMELLYRATRTDNPLEAHGPDSAYAREHAIRREIRRPWKTVYRISVL